MANEKQPVEKQPVNARLSRRAFLTALGVGIPTAILAAACAAPAPPQAAPPPPTAAPTLKEGAEVTLNGIKYINVGGTLHPVADSSPPSPGAKTIAAGQPITGKLATVKGSNLLVPKEIVNDPNAIARYLLELVYAGPLPESNLSIPYINSPEGGIPHNDDKSLLTGKMEPGQSRLTVEIHPFDEVSLYSTGQVFLPVTSEEAVRLSTQPRTVSELRANGKRNVHLIFEPTRLADGTNAIRIPGGKDADQNVKTPGDNVNRGNILIILPPTEQGNTALQMQADSHSNWRAQYNVQNMVTRNNGISANEILPYLLYNPDAQRSEGHGMNTVTSMYKGSNCQGKGCRTHDDQGKEIADMAGIGVYIFQPDPKSKAFTVLAATVLTDSEIPDILRKN